MIDRFHNWYDDLREPWRELVAHAIIVLFVAGPVAIARQIGLWALVPQGIGIYMVVRRMRRIS